MAKIQNLQIVGYELSQITTAIALAECSVDGALNSVFSVSSTVITTVKCAGVAIENVTNNVTTYCRYGA